MSEPEKQTFKSVVFEKISPSIKEGIANLKVLERPVQSLSKGHVRVDVHASATNFFDLLMLVGQYQLKPKLPSGLGSEASGIISEVGPGVKHLKKGQHVIVTMALNCMAEQVVVSAQQCIPKPPTWSHAECAGFSVGYFTAYHGLVQRGGAKAGDTVLVTGASGGMGIIAVQLAKVIGCTVIGVVSTPAKADIVRKAGADHVVVVSAETSLKQTVMKLTQDRGVDIVYDVVGGNGFKDLIGVTARGGRILVIGFASGVIPKIPANLLLVKSISIVGVAAGAEMQRDPSLALEMVNQFISWAFPNKNRGAEADSVKGGQGGVDLRALVPRTIVTVPCDEESIKKLYSDLAGRASLGKGVVMWKPDADKVPALPPSRTVGAAGEGGQLQSKL